MFVTRLCGWMTRCLKNLSRVRRVGRPWILKWVNHSYLLLKNRRVMSLVSRSPWEEDVRTCFRLRNQLMQLSRNLTYWMSRSRHVAQNLSSNNHLCLLPIVVLYNECRAILSVSVAVSLKLMLVSCLALILFPQNFLLTIYTGITWYKAV